MAGETERLLEAEEAVNELLDNLEQLKREIQGYGKARSTLSEAGSQIGALTNQLRELVEQSGGAIKTLSEVGTPKILASIEQLRQANGDLTQRTAELANAAVGSGEQTQRAVEDLARSLGATVDRVSNSIRALSDGNVGLTAMLEKAYAGIKGLATATDHVAAELTTTRTSVASLREGIGAARNQMVEEVQAASVKAAADLDAIKTGMGRLVKIVVVLFLVGWPVVLSAVMTGLWIAQKLWGK